MGSYPGVRYSLFGFIEDPSCAGIRWDVGISRGRQPRNLRCMLGRRVPLGSGAASEDQGDDALIDVLVQDGRGSGIHFRAGLLPELAADAALGRLTLLKDAARRFPVSVVAAIDE